MTTSANTNYRDEKWLREMYLDNDLTQTEIAQRCGVSQRTISRYIRRFEIRPVYHDEEWLREKYVEERLSMTEIARQCGVTPRTISYRIEDSAIESEGIKGDRNPCHRSV